MRRFAKLSGAPLDVYLLAQAAADRKHGFGFSNKLLLAILPSQALLLSSKLFFDQLTHFRPKMAFKGKFLAFAENLREVVKKCWMAIGSKNYKQRLFVIFIVKIDKTNCANL